MWYLMFSGGFVVLVFCLGLVLMCLGADCLDCLSWVGFLLSVQFGWFAVDFWFLGFLGSVCA